MQESLKPHISPSLVPAYSASDKSFLVPISIKVAEGLQGPRDTCIAI